MVVTEGEKFGARDKLRCNKIKSFATQKKGFFWVLGVASPVAGGGQTRAGSVQGGSAPPMRFQDEEICFGRSGIWPPPVWGSIPRFFSVEGVASPVAGGGQTRAGSVQGGSAPPMRFEDEEICFGRSGIWPPPVWGSIGIWPPPVWGSFMMR